MPETNLPWLTWLGQALLESVWQMGICWLIYSLAVRLFPAGSPAARHQLAVVLLGAGFTWFCVTLFSGTSAMVLVNPSAVLIYGPDRTTPLPALFYGMGLLYLVVLAFQLAAFLRHHRQVYRLEKTARGKMPAEWRLYVERMRQLLGIRRDVLCRVSNQLSSPATFGFLKPVILLPVAALTQLTPRQVESLLLHELAHIRRFDYLVNWLVQAVQTLLFFNPFVRLFVRTIELERELSCDQWVMQFRYDPVPYAEALLQLQCQPSRLALAAGGKSHLLIRVENILGIRPQPLNLRRIARQGSCLALLLLALLWINHPPLPTLRSAFASLSVRADWSPRRIESTAAVPENTDDPVRPSPSLITREKSTTAPETEGYIPVLQASSLLLSAEQEAQVQKAIRETQQVVESSAWKVWEKQIAEVLTEREKAGIRKELALRLETEARQRLENRLRQGYNNLNWESINQKLETALAALRSDSLQLYYQRTLQELALIQQSLRTDSLRGVPDSDITLEKLEKWKDSLQQKLDQLRKTRNSVQL